MNLTLDDIHLVFEPNHSRLKNEKTINLFLDLFFYHGVLGERYIKNESIVHINELERLAITPLVFGLMPKKAISRDSVSVPIRPSIEQHLSSLEIKVSNDLVNVIKEVSDQFYQSKSSRSHKNSKYKLHRVKQSYPTIYNKLLESQHGRCLVCGVILNENDDSENRPTLDHCIPWSLIGDPIDGSNWQILCHSCNRIKSEYTSYFHFPEIFNWVYSEILDNFTKFGDSPISKKTRYLALLLKHTCEYPDCCKNVSNSRLFVVPDNHSMPVVDHCKVFCEEHFNLYNKT
jgi:hypothetical protein